MKKITIDDYVSLHQGITAEEGNKIFKLLSDTIKTQEKVELDFTNIIRTTTAFLNVVLGDLYKSYTSEELRNLISFSNLSDANAQRIKRVTDNAKLFYKHQSEVNKAINDNLYGDN